jgi:hypothetical protein
MLPDDFEAELVQAAERGQLRAGEGNARNVEVSLDGRCENFRSGSLDICPGPTHEPVPPPQL